MSELCGYRFFHTFALHTAHHCTPCALHTPTTLGVGIGRRTGEHAGGGVGAAVRAAARALEPRAAYAARVNIMYYRNNAGEICSSPVPASSVTARWFGSLARACTAVPGGCALTLHTPPHDNGVLRGRHRL